jgi:hypothetical protein
MRTGDYSSADKTSTTGLNMGIETNRGAKASPYYANLEITPVVYQKSLPARMSSDSTLDTAAGGMVKVHVGMFFR